MEAAESIVVNGRSTISEEDGSNPPFLASGSARRAQLELHWRGAFSFSGGRSRPKSPCGKAA